MKLWFNQNLSSIIPEYKVYQMGRAYDIADEVEARALIRSGVAKLVNDKASDDKQSKVTSPVKMTKTSSVKAEDKVIPVKG